MKLELQKLEGKKVTVISSSRACLARLTGTFNHHRGTMRVSASEFNNITFIKDDIASFKESTTYIFKGLDLKFGRQFTVRFKDNTSIKILINK
jgi:hypothetical protein